MPELPFSVFSVFAFIEKYIYIKLHFTDFRTGFCNIEFFKKWFEFEEHVFGRFKLV